MIFVIAAPACGHQPAPAKPAAAVPSKRAEDPVPQPLEAAQPAAPKIEPVARDLDAIRADKTLLRKSKRSVYNDPVVKYGFARGTEPVDYVERILNRFAHYKQFVEDEPLDADRSTDSL